MPDEEEDDPLLPDPLLDLELVDPPEVPETVDARLKNLLRRFFRDDPEEEEEEEEDDPESESKADSPPSAKTGGNPSLISGRSVAPRKISELSISYHPTAFRPGKRSDGFAC
jgi:hypothetical protein